MSVEGASFTITGVDVEEELDNVPSEHDIVKKLDMEFATSFHVPSQTGKGNMTAMDFDPKKDHMRVFLRIRPFSEDETNKGENQKCIDVLNEHTIMAHAPKDSHTYKNSVHGNTKASNKFTFSKIFGEDTSQKDFFDNAMMGTVKDFVDGQNCLVFTYGVTNSGKTYTIQGVPHDGGILPRALDVLFNSISGKQMEDMSLKPKMFCDVARLTDSEMEKEVLLKENTLKLATVEEPDVNTLVGSGDHSDMSTLTINSTTNAGSISNLSEDSLMTSRFSTASTVSTTKASIDSLSKDSLDTLIDEAENRVREEGTIDVDFQGQVKFGVWVSFAEIYNEQIFDLLEPPPKKKKAKRSILHLREDKNGVPYIKGLREICVKSADEAYQILNIGKKNLQFACTKLNHNSSRSHCIFTVKLLRVVDKDMPNMARMSMLSLCDLAGSERYSKTQGQGDRIKEASNINTSLLTLGRCIKTLRHNQLNKDQQRIVPFRDSKLTRVFQSFFCGKGRASMVVNINQLASLFDETLHALKYSAIAKEVIVIQEEEKKPPPPKKRGVVSMAFRQMAKNRTTIGWATPGTIAKVIEEEEAGCNLPLPEDDDIDLEEPDDNQVTNLLEVVEHLKKELIASTKQKMEMEVQIREEVCREMAQQLVEIESQYSERVKEAQYLAEEKAEKKIELLTMSMKKTKKRKRFMDQDDEDEYVSSVLLHAEQVKLQERDAMIATLKKELSAMEKIIKEYAEEKETLTEKVSKLQFDNTHLNDKIQQFNNMVEEQAQLFNENNEQMVQLEQRIRVRDARISELEQIIQTKACQENTGQMSELISRLADVEQQLDEKEEAIIKMEQMTDMLTCDLSDKVAQVEKLESQIAAAKQTDTSSGLTVDDQVLTEDCTETATTEAIHQLQKEVETLRSQLHLKQSKIIQLETICEENTTKYSEDLNEKNGVIKDLNVAVEQSEKKLKEIVAELDSRNEEVVLLKDRVKKLEQDVRDLNSDLESTHQSLEAKTNEMNVMRTATDLTEAMKERLNCLEEELQESKNEARTMEKAKNREIVELKDKLMDLETRLQTREMDVTRYETDIFEALEKVSDGDQECSRLKTLVLEQERQIGELKVTQEDTDRLKCELTADVGALKTKLDTVEGMLSDRDKENEELMKQVEVLKSLVSEKDKALSGVTQELGGLRNSLDSESGNVTILEASLHQANEAMRCKGLEVEELEKKIEEIQVENTQLKNTVNTLRSKVNEDDSGEVQQGETKRELMQKYTEECSKVKVLGKKVCDLECQLRLLQSEKEESCSTEKEDRLVSEMQEVKLKLTNEKEQWEAQVKSLEQKLEEKDQLVQKMCIDCEKLKKTLDGERKETRAAKNQLQESECLFENVERELKHEKGQREENKAEISKLQLNIHDLENKLKDSQAMLTDSNSSVQELEKKVTGLQASLDLAGEVEEDLQEISANLDQMTEERDRLQAKQCEMEQEIAQLRGQELGSDSSEELVQELRLKVRQLQGKVEDAEYKSQMSNRQMRREKAQLDKLLKETEGSLTQSEEKVEQLEEQLTEVKNKEREAYESKVEQYRKKAEKLEDVVHDLDHCLRSSKGSEVKLQKIAEEYRQKYRDLEKQYAIVEDQLKELYDKRDSIASEKDHNEFRFNSVLEEKQKGLEELRSTICDLREEIITLQDIINRNSTEYGRQMFEKNELIASLEGEVKTLQRDMELCGFGTSNRVSSESKEVNSKQEQLEAELKDREMVLEVKVNRIALLESDLKEQVSELKRREQRIDALECELEKREGEGEVCSNRLECVEQELESKIMELENQRTKVKQLEKDLTKRQDESSKHQVQSESLEEELEKNTELIDNLQAEHDEKRKKIDSLEAELNENRKMTNSLHTELHGRSKKIDSLEAELDDKRKMIDSLEAELDDKRKMIDSLEAELDDKRKMIDSLEAELDDKRKMIDSLEVEGDEKMKMIDSLEIKLQEVKENNEQVKMQFNQVNLNKQETIAEFDQLKSGMKENEELIEKLKSQLESVKDTVDSHDLANGSTLEEKIEFLVKELHSKTAEIEQLANTKHSSEEKLVSLDGRCCALQEELHSLKLERDRLQEQNEQVVSRERLDSELESAKVETEQLRVAKQQLEKDLNAREKSIENYNKRITLLKEESQQLTQQLEKSQEGESKLRAQMREWSTQMEEQATQFVQLQEKLKEREKEREEQVVKLETQDKQLQQVKSEIETLKTSLQSKEDQCQEVRRAGQQEVDSIRLEVKQLQLDLEVKDKRLEKKNKKISELLQEGCEQGKKCEIAFHDVQANEKLIEQLKKAMEEQEQVMVMQDTHTKKKEEECEQLLKEVETVTEKYNALLKESAESTSQLRQAEHMQRRNDTERAEQRREIQDLQGEVDMLRKRLSEVESAKQLANIDKALVGDLESRLMGVKTEHECTKQDLIKSERDKLRLEADMKDCNTELRNMERDLEQARKDRENMRRELEKSQEKEVEITKVKDKLQEEFSQSEVARGQAQLLRQKFQSLEEQKCQLEKELDFLKDQIKTADEKKELELQKWRQDRDKLVSQLQDILTKKDVEIKALKEGAAGSSDSNVSEEVASLKAQLGDKDAIIAELSSHLEKNAPKTRRGRHKKGHSTTGSDEEMDSLKRELASVHQQLESERQTYVKQMDTQIKAKNEIIGDLKAANETLQSHLKRLQVTAANDPLHTAMVGGTQDIEEESLGIQCDLDGTPTLKSVSSGGSVATGKTGKRTKKQRGRPKKRKSSESEDTQSIGSEDLSESSTKLTQGGTKRNSTRHHRSHKKSFRLDENEEPSMGVIREEDVVDLSMLDMNRSGARVLNNSTNLLDLPDHGKLLNSTPKADNRQPTFVSPCTDHTQPPPSTLKKKKRLHKTQVDQPFADSPDEPTQVDRKTTKSDAHQIVKRKLRSRKH